MPPARPTERQTPVAASGLLADVIGGRPVDGLVVASGRLAAYLTYACRGGDRVLGVVTRRATCPASGLVLPPGREPLDLLPAGTRVRIGDGAIEAPTARLVVGRWFLPASAPRRGVPRPELLAAARSAVEAQAVPPEVTLARRDGARAAQALLRGDTDDAHAQLVGLLGRGPGLTPSGDDVVAGVLLASRRVLPYEEAEAVATAVRRAARLATTVVSRGMLSDAGAGWCPDVVARGLAALVAPPGGQGEAAGRAAVHDLLRVGHTSGGDLLCGALGVLEEAARPQEVA
jgi:hypothetical protein